MITVAMLRSSWLALCLVAVGLSTDSSTVDWATLQLAQFKANLTGPVSNLTLNNGAPVDYNGTRVLNKNIINNQYFMESMTHVVREFIPSRPLHVKGSGAFGYFEVTQNISDICKAKVFSRNGKKTRVAVRFSTAAPIPGLADTYRNHKGFAVKFYTEEGNFDIPGFNMPTFPFKDPTLFASFVHCQKKNPVSNVIDVNILWDFITLHKESYQSFLWVFSNQGAPDGYTHMTGASIHTLQVYNDKGESYFTRFYFKPDLGLKNLTNADAIALAGTDPDYYSRDLYNAIASQNFPSWTVYIQKITLEQVKNYTETPDEIFDVTKVIPEDQYPLTEIGRLVLNENPSNYFADVEQAAYCPASLVPGILGAPDKIYEARRFSYRDAQNYRLGPNFSKMPVNAPLQTAQVYDRDGYGPVNQNMGGYPTIYPNSFYGPVAVKELNKPELLSIYETAPNNTAQCKAFYQRMTSDEQSVLIENLCASLGLAVEFLQIKSMCQLMDIDEDLGTRVAKKLGLYTSSCHN